MQEDRFDSWLRESAASYNEPPAADVDGMWAEIERQHFNQVAPRTQWWANSWLRVAAALVIGVGLGRVTLTSAPSALAPTALAANTSDNVSNAPEALRALNAPDANKYLGQTVALLASLQSDGLVGRNNPGLSRSAADLLNTTRFLLDSPTTKDPNVRALLEDLELVLAQVVQMPRNRSASDVEVIHQAMEQRDVMPRLRTAVANNYSAE